MKPAIKETDMNATVVVHNDSPCTWYINDIPRTVDYGSEENIIHSQGLSTIVNAYYFAHGFAFESEMNTFNPFQALQLSVEEASAEFLSNLSMPPLSDTDALVTSTTALPPPPPLHNYNYDNSEDLLNLVGF